MKYSFVLVLGLALALSWGGQVFAQTQTTVSGIKYDAGIPQMTVIDQDHWIAIADLRGVTVYPPASKGPSNNMASDTKIVLYGDKNGSHYQGYITLMDNDGDKIVWDIWDFPPGSQTGKGKIIAATGKFAGMEGTMDTQTTGLKGFQEGTWNLVGKCVEKLTFKNPQ